MKPEEWLKVEDAGLFCVPGNFYIDPHHPVETAIITHGHGDHARPGHRTVLTTPETAEIMKVRYGADSVGALETIQYGQSISRGWVTVTLHPAGHILGSAQIAMEYKGQRIVVSGDYKRRIDGTCAAFEPVACDVFVTEATFGLPVFRHPNDHMEIEKLLSSLRLFPERTHVVGTYALGKCQRILHLLRQRGYDQPIYLHGALEPLTALYERHGVSLGAVKSATHASASELAGALVLAPPGSISDRWSRRFADPIIGMASGWLRVKQRAKQRGVELPLIISDHADWDELSQTITDVGAPELWVTHGREEALVHQAMKMGVRARALALIGFEEEGQ